MTTPGANIILDTNDRIDCGVYADIFRPSEGEFVYKLFVGVRHHTTASQGLTDPEKDDHRRRKTFDSECRAYEIAAHDAFLCDHIPHSFRRCEICRRDRIQRKRRRRLPAYLLLSHGIHRRRGHQTIFRGARGANPQLRRITSLPDPRMRSLRPLRKQSR